MAVNNERLNLPRQIRLDLRKLKKLLNDLDAGRLMIGLEIKTTQKLFKEEP